MNRDEAFFSALATPGLQRLRAYDPGHDLIALRRRFGVHATIELGANENPYGPSPRAREAVIDALGGIFRYPDPLGGDLKRALAKLHGLSVESLILGNGSHEILMQLGQAFAGPGSEVVVSRYGFAVYALSALASGAELGIAEALPREHAMARGHDLEALAARVTPRTRLVFLANPNNPTGTWVPTAVLERFLAALPEHVIAVVDEAYAEFVNDPALPSALGLRPRFPNLVVTRTFSKAYGLAGLRIGYAAADPGLIAVLERLRESFNINSLGLAAAEAALGDRAHLAWVVERNAEERDWLAARLAAREHFVHPSQTNFLLVEFGARAAEIEAALVERGVVLRPMAGYGLPECLRVTVGTRAENLRLLAALDEVGA